jgi:hypothetical protein
MKLRPGISGRSDLPLEIPAEKGLQVDPEEFEGARRAECGTEDVAGAVIRAA